MPTIRQLKRRITSVQNTAKITNALQLVAASKMRRAQDRATQGRPYAEKIQGVLASLASTGEAGEDDGKHPFLVQRPVKNIGILHITPDRGLCGALNSNLNREAASFVAETNEPVSMVAVGKKGRDFFLRSELNLDAEFTELGDYPALTQTQTFAKVIMEDYLNGRGDKVFISFGEFINTVNQQPVIKQLLPVIPPEQADGEADDALTQEYIFEPNPLLVYERLLPR